MVSRRQQLDAAMVSAIAAFCCPAAVSGQVRAVRIERPACPLPPLETARIVARIAHDPTAFTQGLLWHDGALFESTGQPGRSQVRRLDPATGRVVARRAIPPAQFGEGLALNGGELVMLTWTSGIAHRFDAATLRPRGSWRYRGEGWGLTTLGDRLVRSDGGDRLIFHDRRDFAERGRVAVRLGDQPLRELNELEVIDGQVWANVWTRPAIVAIDPASGCVTRRVDLSPLVEEVAATDTESVLNGIAWDARRRRLFVTGKYWPTIFEIALDR